VDSGGNLYGEDGRSNHSRRHEIKNIGFVSTRLQGTDGVSLETEKWANVLKRMGYQCFYFAGLSDWDPKRTIKVPEAFFDHPLIRDIQSKCFKVYRRTSELTGPWTSSTSTSSSPRTAWQFP
jgi:hypothetical protein